MAIEVVWQDENGAVIARGPSIDAILIAHAPAESCCLRFVDPWGDTLFNQLQLNALLQELRTIADDAQADAVRPQARALAEFAASASNSVHTCIKFVGD